MKHRILALALTVCLCLALTPPAFAQWTPPEDAPEAAAVYLENLDTGTVIYERNADEQRPIASLTKMMTCLLLAESGLDLDETFAVPEALSPEFARIRSENGAYIDLQPGEEVTLRDLAYCTMLPSTNDSASTIAWRVAGSLDDFVAQMNQRAAQLGCTDTRYSCPHGLYDVGNYSTAHDLARIAEACMNNDVLRTICTTQEWWLPLDNVHQTVLTPDAPAGKFADHVLVAKSGMVSVVDSLVAAMSVINALVVSIGRSQERLLTQTFENLEHIWDEYDVYERVQ